jgi:hypothetical protein
MQFTVVFQRHQRCQDGDMDFHQASARLDLNLKLLLDLFVFLATRQMIGIGSDKVSTTPITLGVM